MFHLYNVLFLLHCVTGGPSCPTCPLAWAFGDFFLMNKWPLWAFPVGLCCHNVHGLKSGLPSGGAAAMVMIRSSHSALCCYSPSQTWVVFLRASAKAIWLSGADRSLVWYWQCEGNLISVLLCFYPPAQPGLLFIIGVCTWALCLLHTFKRNTQD